jgi:chaperonin GroES
MADEDDLPEGETVEIEDDKSDVVDTEDGGAIVTLTDEDEVEPRSPDFYKNLAEELPTDELERISSRFIELIGRDREARKKRDEQYEDGIRRTGLGDDAPGGAQFQGASRVVHPMLTEACIDFSSRAMKELFPPSGPVKDFIPGDVTRDKAKKAQRKTKFMNWQLTVQSPEFRAELEQLLTQVPLGGAQYMKVTWSEARNRPEFLFVAIDDMYLPFAATNFYSAQRKTHVQYLTALDYQQRVKSGMYRDIDLIPSSMEPERSVADVANDKIEGRSDTSYNEDGLRTVYEIYAMASIEDDEEPAPYIISIDKISGKVLAIYRNWDEHDESREELQWFVEFPFVPWRGAYPIGLPHMIGGLAAAATGALRALLDSAHISNSQTMLKLKGGTRGGQTLNIQPTQVEEIEGGLNVDDVRKIAMPLPFNPPSSVLYQLLGFLVDASRGVVRTTLDDVADGNPNAPVGTTLAKLEQGMVVFSAIHSRLHDAMARMLRILHRLNGMYLNDEDVEDEVGEELATRADFDGPMDVVPVSDPNIFSEAQRFAQVQALTQRAAALPQLYNARKVEERLLETLKIPNAKDLLTPAVEPKEQNAVNENVAATMGRPIVAFPEQDHIAHLKAHLSYMMNPALGMSRLIAPAYIPVILNHIKEHVALWYAATVFELGNETAGTDIGEAMKENKTAEDKQAFDRMLAEASQIVSQQAAQVFGSLPPIIEQAVQMMQQLAPPQPMDPAQAAMAETQRRTQADQQRMQLDAQKLQISAQTEAQKLQLQQQIQQQKTQIEAQRAQVDAMRLQLDAAGEARDAQLEAQKLQIEQAIQQAELQLRARESELRMVMERERQDAENRRNAAAVLARSQMNTQDNMTALNLAQLEVASDQKFTVSTGTGINPGT